MDVEMEMCCTRKMDFDSTVLALWKVNAINIRVTYEFENNTKKAFSAASKTRSWRANLDQHKRHSQETL